MRYAVKERQNGSKGFEEGVHLVRLSFGHWVPPMATPWMTTTQPPHAQPSSAPETVYLKGFKCEIRTRRDVSTWRDTTGH